jgi:hypothetical protein
MKKIVPGLVFAAALIAIGASAQTPPDLVASSKKLTKDQATPSPIVVPLGVGSTINAALDDVLDTRKTRGGDPVTAEVTEDVMYQRSVIFPKGTKVIGHIVRVTSGGRGRAGSAVFVQFDKAILKDGQAVLLNAGIQALAVGSSAPPADVGAPKGEGTEPRALPVGDNSTELPPNGPLVVSTVYEPPRRTLRPPLGAAPAAEGEFTSDGLFTPESKGVFGRPDLKVYTPTSDGSHGTVLLSSKKNMHLDPGTHLLLVVQPPPSGAEVTADGSNGLDLAPH